MGLPANSPQTRLANLSVVLEIIILGLSKLDLLISNQEAGVRERREKVKHQRHHREHREQVASNELDGEVATDLLHDGEETEGDEDLHTRVE